MRLLVCGGRTFNDQDTLWRALDGMRAQHGEIVLIHGAAKGADWLAHKWAVCNAVTVHAYPADWKAHGLAAGPIRNARMLAEGKPDMVLACPGGKGTANMMKQAAEKLVPVVLLPKPSAGNSASGSPDSPRGRSTDTAPP